MTESAFSRPIFTHRVDEYWVSSLARPQPDNISSARLAEASGFSLFATWNVIKLDEDEA